MKVHEYQAKEMLAAYGVPVPRGRVAKTAAEAREVAAELGGRVVVKAQVHAGGRGKAGGIKLVNSPAEAEEAAAKLLGSRLVTHQTTPQGVPVSAVLVEEATDIARELYLGIVVDTSARMPLIMASEAGGMEIEEVARESPEKIIRSYIDPGLGIRPFQTRRLAYGLNLEASQVRSATELISNLFRLFQANDCSLAEINPLVVTAEGKLVALDAKLNFDDNAIYRHRDIGELRDLTQEDPLEVEAASKGVNNYVKMEGNIGIVVNGAGLAMSVMDLVKLSGGDLANFLDIGTLNDSARVVNAFHILTSDPDVKAVLINIFGGMARVDIIAEGLIQAHQEMEIRVPLVVRLAGTNVEEGERILAESKLDLIRAADMAEAAKLVVEAAAKQS